MHLIYPLHKGGMGMRGWLLKKNIKRIRKVLKTTERGIYKYTREIQDRSYIVK